MNQVCLIGRITRDPEVRYGAQSQTAVARFSIAINRGKDRNGNDAGTDYPNIVCFGKTAETVEKYVTKGMQLGITGKLQTGSYEKNGQRHYTVEVVADRVEFLSSAESGQRSGERGQYGAPGGGGFDAPAPAAPPEGFEEANEDIPF
jgi:single-strand DNA-binding protein